MRLLFGTLLVHHGSPMTDDEKAIRDVIARQFASLNWRPGTSGDWQAFTADFLPGAPLYAAARPVKAQSVDEFVARMQALAATKLGAFAEAVLGVEVRIFANVAIAAAGCAITENDSGVTCGVEMMLLVKEDGAWRIAAQAWDTARDEEELPAALRAPG